MGICDVIIRHPKERKSKCSVEPLRGRSDLVFYTANQGFSFDATGYLLLAPGVEPLSKQEGDAELSLLLLDSTWKLLPKLKGTLTGNPIVRSLPEWMQTAYPRKSKDGSDPDAGLATVEALYAARWLLQRPDESILDRYHWKEQFLAQFSKM